MTAIENAGPDSADAQPKSARRRQQFVLASECRWVAMYCGAILLAMLVDWWGTLFDPAARLALTSAAGLTWLIGLIVMVRRARARRSALREVLPEESANRDDLAATDALAARRSERSGPAILGGVLALWAIAWLADPAQFVVLWRRFWSPLQEICLTQVESSTAGALIARGEPFAIEARTVNRVRDQATIFLRDAYGKTTEHAMTGSAGRFTFPIAAVDQPLEYRIRAGDGQTPWHSVQVADRPFLTFVEYRITPPADSGLPVVTAANLPRQTRVRAGSTIEIGFIVNEPARDARLLGADGAALPLERLSECTFRFYQEVTQDIEFRMSLTNEYGLTNESPPRYRIDVDRGPSSAELSAEE